MCILSSLGRIHTERERERENEWVDSWKMDYWMVTVWEKLKWIVGICWGSKERWNALSFLNFTWWTPINEYGPSLSMSVHMFTSVHVGEPVIVWHATSSLKEPPHLFSLMPDHQPLLFIPSLTPHSFLLIIRFSLFHRAPELFALPGGFVSMWPSQECCSIL